MANANLYEIYDLKTMNYIPGKYRAKEVMEMLHINSSISEQAKIGTVIQGRYRIVIAGERIGQSASWAEEWDKARLKILRKKK